MITSAALDSKEMIVGKSWKKLCKAEDGHCPCEAVNDADYCPDHINPDYVIPDAWVVESV